MDVMKKVQSLCTSVGRNMTPMTTTALTVRPATEADAIALRTLATLDEDAPLTGRALLVEQDGRPVAALSLEENRAVADPFVASAGAVALLRLRAGQLARGPSRPRRELGLRARFA
jgi:hypothetical protein